MKPHSGFIPECGFFCLLQQRRVVEIAVLLRGIEAWAYLRRGAVHLVVTTDDRLREAALEVDKQTHEGAALGNRAGVLGAAVGSETTLIADADGAAVERAAMGAYLVQSAVTGDGSVAPDVEVVAHVDETSGEVVTAQLFGGVRAVLTCRRAVDDEILHGVGVEGDAVLHV